MVTYNRGCRIFIRREVTMQSNIIVTSVVIVYLLVMLLIGYLSSKRIESNTDFVVAGRRLGPILMAGTLAATEIGGGSSLGVVQQGMESHGFSAAWYIITMGFAFVILTFLAPKFRAAMVKTVPEYFRRRYGKSSGVITALIMFVPLIGLTAGTIASLVAGTIVVVYLENISGGSLFGIQFSQPIVPGLIAGLLAFLIFSIAMPPKNKTTELAEER